MVIQKLKPVWLLLIIAIITSNFMLYQTSIGAAILPPASQGVVLGSLLDFTILLPLTIMLYRRKFSIKLFIILAALGCVLMRFIVPAAHLAPFATVTWIGIGAELALIAFELLLLITFVRYLPRIIKDVRASALPTLFSFADATTKYAKDNLIIKVICTELLMFYYALASWRKPIRPGITLYKKSSFIAFQVMMIHAIIVETLGVHYWLHSKAPIVSLVLLVLNIYSIFFFLGDLQALRHNPIYSTDKTLYISLGLMKRTAIDFTNIEEIIEDNDRLAEKLSKDTADFISRDFESVQPQFLLKMKEPQTVTLFLGKEQTFNYIAIKCDDPAAFKALLTAHMPLEDTACTTL